MKSNKYLTKVVAGVVSASIVSSSCTGYILDDYQEITEDDLSDDGESAIQIELTNENLVYLEFLNKLGNDILKTPSIAEEFALNPKEYLKKYGYDKDIDLDEGMLKLILALGDKEINDAINIGDIKQFIVLLKERNLLDSYSNVRIDLSGSDVSTMSEIITQEPAVFTIPVYMVAIFISYAAAAYTAVIGVSVAAYLGVAVEVAGPTSTDESRFLDNNPVFKIWQLKGDTEKTYIATDLYLEEEANMAIEAIEIYNKDAFKNKLSKEEFKNFFKLNMLKNRTLK